MHIRLKRLAHMILDSNYRVRFWQEEFKNITEIMTTNIVLPSFTRQHTARPLTNTEKVNRILF